MQHAKASIFKGLIVADPPGLGKTLSALLAIAAIPKKSRSGPCLVVAPQSCCDQWINQISTFFDPTELRPIKILGSDSGKVSSTPLAQSSSAPIFEQRRASQLLKQPPPVPRVPSQLSQHSSLSLPPSPSAAQNQFVTSGNGAPIPTGVDGASLIGTQPAKPPAGLFPDTSSSSSPNSSYHSAQSGDVEKSAERS